MGRLTAAHGIKGWLKLISLTDPLTNVFDYQPWYISAGRGVGVPHSALEASLVSQVKLCEKETLRQIELLDWRPQGKVFVVQIKGVTSRNQAELLCPADVVVEKSLLSPLEEGEYYWHQLLGCRVVSEFEGGRFDFGVVRYIESTGANDVLVVEGDEKSCDAKDRWLPFVLGEFVSNVDLDDQVITVNWDPDF